VTNDFDPNHEPVTSDEADAYVGWCAENFMRLSEGAHRTYRTAVRCASWVLVVSCASLHLDDDQEQDREALLEQLAMYSGLARAIERQREHYPIERLIVMRSTLDCWSPCGLYADNLLGAAKAAISALMLIELHPLVDLWNLEAPDVWALLVEAREALAIINEADELDFQDFAVRRDDHVTGLFTWQRANNLSRGMGGGKLSQN
jgi:hypothetical protein